MQLKLVGFEIYEPFSEGEQHSVAARLDIVFKEGEAQIGGTIGLTFKHADPRNLTFAQIEALALAQALSRI
jgi:hypothetical protein